MKNITLTEIARNNKTTMKAHFIMAIIMTLFCLLQSLSGRAPVYYGFLVAFLGFTPVLIERYFWKKDMESPMIKHVAAIGFAIFYTYSLFTSVNNLVFVFVIPMVIVISIFNDAKFSLLINAGIVIEIMIMIAIGATTGKLGYAGQDSATIQLVIMILIGFFSYMTSNTLHANAQQKIDNIADSHEKTAQVLQEISELSENMKNGIATVHEELMKLSVSAASTKQAMQEVSLGATETANTVQNQGLQTQAIQSKVDVIKDAATQITDNMQQTLTVLEQGNADMNLLVEKVDISVQNGAEAAEKLNTLEQNMKEMNSIVELINGVASQTTLLALNASIEAARAGEAGRGFTVVATQISAMATQTGDATVHITRLIEDVSSSIRQIIDVIYQMIDGINAEKQSAVHTADGFASIQENTVAVRNQVETLLQEIMDLKNANQEIVDSIQTISAISEELSAHAAETTNAEESNTEILDNIAERMEDLRKLATK